MTMLITGDLVGVSEELYPNSGGEATFLGVLKSASGFWYVIRVMGINGQLIDVAERPDTIHNLGNSK